MTGFVTQTAAAMIILLSFTYGAPVDKFSTHCKISKTAQGLIKHLLPMSLILGGEVYRSYTNISTKWLTPADQWITAEFSFSLPQPLNRSGLKPRLVLLADHNILSSFLSLVKNSTVNFQRLPNGTAVVHRLVSLESALRTMISFMRRLERTVNFGVHSNATAPVGSISSGSHVTAVMPIRTSQVTSQNSTGYSTLPTIHSVALRVSFVLNDLYSSLLQMDVDFDKILRTKCI